VDGQQLLVYGLVAAGLLALWVLFKIAKKIVFVVLVVVAVIGIVLGLSLAFF